MTATTSAVPAPQARALATPRGGSTGQSRSSIRHREVLKG
jgi:hypothetical protein